LFQSEDASRARSPSTPGMAAAGGTRHRGVSPSGDDLDVAALSARADRAATSRSSVLGRGRQGKEGAGQQHARDDQVGGADGVLQRAEAEGEGAEGDGAHGAADLAEEGEQ